MTVTDPKLTTLWRMAKREPIRGWTPAPPVPGTFEDCVEAARDLFVQNEAVMEVRFEAAS